MRKRILYFDMEKIIQNTEPLCESEQEVAAVRLAHDPKSVLYLRLDLEAALKTLTPRQLEVMGLVAQGYTEREIAPMLSISSVAVHKLLAKARITLKKSLEGG